MRWVESVDAQEQLTQPLFLSILDGDQLSHSAKTLVHGHLPRRAERRRSRFSLSIQRRASRSHSRGYAFKNSLFLISGEGFGDGRLLETRSHSE